MASDDQKKRTLIEKSFPRMRFSRITTLFYGRENGEEVEEFAPHRGWCINQKRGEVTMSAGDRVANVYEIWLHSDGTLHKYLWTANWETIHGCSQRLYVGPADLDDVSLAELKEEIALNFREQRESRF